MDQEEFQIAMLWVMFARLGIKINSVTDDKVIKFTVPKLSDYIIKSEGLPEVLDNIPEDQAIAGDMLLDMANTFFEDNGFVPNGYVRHEYWTIQMGEAAVGQAQQEMK